MRACVIVRGEWSGGGGGGGGGGGNWSQRAAFRMNGGGGRPPPRAYAGSGAAEYNRYRTIIKEIMLSLTLDLLLKFLFDL